MPFTICPCRRFLPLGSLITVLLLSVGPVYAEWVKVYETGDGMSFYYDPDTIRHIGTLRQMWALYDYSAPQTVMGIPYLSLTVQEEYDCTEERVRILAEMAYAGKMRSGEVVYTISDETQWRPVAPGTIYQSSMTYLCAKK